jgi:type II secretory pathway pseudopilin PulG
LPFALCSRRRGGLLIEVTVVMSIFALVLGLVVPLYIHVQRAGERMQAQARAVVAAREASAQLRRDVQAAERVRVSPEGLSLAVRERGGVGEIRYSRSGRGWVRRSGPSLPGSPPVWLRDEIRSLTFRAEGTGVQATIVADAGFQGARPVRVDLFAVPRSGGTH